jgi:hypothetical protein
MCDYSLAHFPNRLAVEGEQLIVHRFDTLSIGLAPARRGLKDSLFCSCPAVCVPPGARLLLRDIPKDLQRRWGLSAVEEVTFAQLSADAFIHRDAIRFTNGQETLLQNLQCGQRVDVVSLGVAEEELTPAAEGESLTSRL